MPVTPKRGALPTDRNTLAAATPFRRMIEAPPRFLRNPARMSSWGNLDWGDCVIAEEAFAKACTTPEIFITDEQVIAWAERHNVLEGAHLPEVLSWMQSDGLHDGHHSYLDGMYFSVDWADPGTLRDAIFHGPVKIGVGADQITKAWFSNDGRTGWVGTGWQNEDKQNHCVSLCGYGTLSWLATELGATLPPDVNGASLGYAMFTWDSIGIVDAASVLAVTHEAWVRDPTTIMRTDNAWSTWASLGGVITTAPTVASNSDGRMEVFARGTDSAVWHMWQTAPNNGWSQWASLGGVITSNIAVGRNADGRLEAFARGADNALWHIWQTAPDNAWSQWASLGGVITTDPVVASNSDGRMEVFARGTDNALWHIWQTAPSNGWSQWGTLGGVLTSNIAIGRNADGRLEAFVRSTDNGLWHIWQTAPNSGWSEWARLDGLLTSNVTVASNADGRLEAFVRSTDNGLWHIWQTAPNSGWSEWARLGGVLTSDITIGHNEDGRLDAFALGTDSALYHIWQVDPNSGWSEWESLGGVLTTNIAIGENADGRPEAFARGADNALWHVWHA